MTVIAIVGSLTFPDHEIIRAFVRALPPETVLLSGASHGVDWIANAEARQRGLAVQAYLADWARNGASAETRRNQEMIAAADRHVAFWDGSRDLASAAIAFARRAGTPVQIIPPSISGAPLDDLAF